MSSGTQGEGDHRCWCSAIGEQGNYHGLDLGCEMRRRMPWLLIRTITVSTVNAIILVMAIGCVVSAYPVGSTRIDSSIATSTVHCTEVVQPEFHKVVGLSLASTEELKDWIASTYNVESGSIEMHIQSEPVRKQSELADTFNWSTENGSYRLDALDHVPLALWTGGYRFTLASVMTCLGKPTHYIADYRPAFEFAEPMVILYLFFPEHGTVMIANIVYGIENDSASATSYPLKVDVNHTTTPNSIRISSPTENVDQLLQEYLDNAIVLGESQSDNDIRGWYLEMLRPWPETHASLEYETVSGP